MQLVTRQALVMRSNVHKANKHIEKVDRMQQVLKEQISLINETADARAN